MTDSERLSEEAWWASLPTVYVSAGAFITDPAGRTLLVKPNYRPHWGFPGGIVEAGEAPHEGCAREVLEEVGLDLHIGHLLVVDWVPSDADRPRPSVYFLFDGGQVDGDRAIVLQEDELDDHAFVTVEEGTALLDSRFAHRLPRARRARRTGQTEYLPMAGPAGDAIGR